MEVVPDIIGGRSLAPHLSHSALVAVRIYNSLILVYAELCVPAPSPHNNSRQYTVRHSAPVTSWMTEEMWLLREAAAATLSHFASFLLPHRVSPKRPFLDLMQF